MVQRFFRFHLATGGLGVGLVGLAAAGLITLGACGGSDSSPSSPTASTPEPQPTPTPTPTPTPAATPTPEPQPTPTPIPTPTPPPSSATVTITSAGVSPKSVTIAVGGTVTFVNNDTTFHEMQSDPHPIHTDCPPMNAVGTLAAGQSRSTGGFTTARTCGYHDHLRDGNTNLRGTIVIQ